MSKEKMQRIQTWARQFLSTTSRIPQPWYVEKDRQYAQWLLALIETVVKLERKLRNGNRRSRLRK